MRKPSRFLAFFTVPPAGIVLRTLRPVSGASEILRIPANGDSPVFLMREASDLQRGK